MARLLITVILLVLLEGVKRLITWAPHPSDYFYFNLCSCLQVFLFAGCILILITRPLLKKFIKKRLFMWQSLGYVFIVLVLELLCSYMLSHPRSVPSTVFPAFKYYYDHFECRIIQYEPAYTRFDPELYYSLRGNAGFVYRNREYADSFSINSQGFRDDEASLSRPDIICVGDSYTLGWGAGARENYPALLEAMTGRKVLNTGMSSYGTARESMVLSKTDTSQARYIVWQYCANDEEENRAFLAAGRSLSPHSPQSLDSVMRLHAWTRKYFPGRHLFTIAKLSAGDLVQRLPLPMRAAPSPRDDSVYMQQARDFLDIAGSTVNLSKTKLIVLEPGPYPLQGRFIYHLKELVRQRNLGSSVLFVDCSTLLTKEDFYILDVHLNAKGNEKVARAIAQIITH